MSFLPVPNPRTYTAGEFATAAELNAIRDAINFLTNPPIFKGVQTTVQSTTSAAWVAMSLDTTSTDSYGGHSNTSNNSRYVSQVAGWYWVLGFAAWASAVQSEVDCVIAVNGATVPGSAQFLPREASAVAAADAAALVFLAVGSYVEVWGRQASGGALNTFAGSDLAPALNVFWMHT